LSCYYFFFYSYTIATTGTTTTITYDNVSEGEGTPKTSYKLWSSEFLSFGRKKEQTTPKLVLLPNLGLGNMHTPTHKVWLQYKIYTWWCNPTYICFPYTWVFMLAFRLCTHVCFWTCRYVMNNLCSTFERKNKKYFLKKHEIKKKIFSFLHAIITKFANSDRFAASSPSVPFHLTPLLFHPTSISVWPYRFVHLTPSIYRHSFITIHPRQCTVFSNHMLC
jgi:hypothetical protein